MLLGAILGFACGAWLSGHWEQLGQAPGEKVRRDALAGFLKLGGDIFMNLLKMLVVPLIVLSITHAMGSLGDLRRTGRVFAVTLVYFLSSMFLACALGLVLVNTIQPGRKDGQQSLGRANSRYRF